TAASSWDVNHRQHRPDVLPAPLSRARPSPPKRITTQIRRNRWTSPTPRAESTTSARPAPDNSPAPASSQDSRAQTAGKAYDIRACARTTPAAAGWWMKAESKAGRASPQAIRECATPDLQSPAVSSLHQESLVAAADSQPAVLRARAPACAA